MNISSLTLISSIPSLNTAAGDAAQSQDVVSTRSLSAGDSQSSAADSSQDGLQERRQVALTLVKRTLTAAYEKMSSRANSAVAAYEDVEPLTPAKVASNILGFIERRLQQDAADGATQEQLQSRLDAGLSGFQKGFAEASEQLKALSQLSPEVASDIGQTKDLVLKGIDDLRSKFIKATTDQPAVDPAVTAVPVSATPVTDPTSISQVTADKAAVAHIVKSSTGVNSTSGLQLPTVLSSGLGSKLQNNNYDYASASQFSFQLTTAEGDKVTITASASIGVSAGQSTKTTNGSSDNGVSSGQSMSYSVDGNLSESELKAINDLLGHVNDLAGQFFSGNLDEAFNQAVSLGYDKSQIGSFALSLTQVDIQQVPEPEVTDAAVAKEAALKQSDAPVALPDEYFPLGNFIKNVLEALKVPSSFDNPQKLLTDISSNMIGKDEEGKVQATRFSDFVKGIFALNLSQSTGEATDPAASTDTTKI